MKREDVLNVDSLKEELREGMAGLTKTIHSVFGEVVYALDTVIDSHNALQAQLNTVSERLLRVEEHLSDQH